jgi:hypothetical protein
MDSIGHALGMSSHRSWLHACMHAHAQGAQRQRRTHAPTLSSPHAARVLDATRMHDQSARRCAFLDNGAFVNRSCTCPQAHHGADKRHVIVHFCCRLTGHGLLWWICCRSRCVRVARSMNAVCVTIVPCAEREEPVRPQLQWASQEALVHGHLLPPALHWFLGRHGSAHTVILSSLIWC